MTRPPRLAEWLLTASLDAQNRPAVLGDLTEEFTERCTSDGRPSAARWYWRQTVTSLGPNLKRRLGGSSPSAASPRRGLMAGGWQDLRYSWRMMLRYPLVTGISMLSLAVGIGMATVVFNLLDAGALAPVRVTDPHRLALVLEQRTDSLNRNFSYPDYADYRAGQEAFVDLVAYSPLTVTLRSSRGSEQVAAELVSGTYFQTLGVRLTSGRGLGEGDDQPGAPPAVVVSEGLWRALWEDSAFETKRLSIGGQEYAVVGVAERGFRGMIIGRDVRLWAPIAHQPLLRGGTSLLAVRNANWLTVLGRLRPGLTLDQAAANLNLVEGALAPQVGRATPRSLLAVPGHQGDSTLPGTIGGPLTTLLAGALLLVLAAGANIAGLLVGRTSERGRELALRVALGAARWRVARLVLTEVLLLCLAGTALGWLVAIWTTEMAVPFLSRFGQPVVLDVATGGRQLAFLAALAIGCSSLAGFVSIVGVRRLTLGEALAEGGRSASAGRSSLRLRRGLVVVQFAVSLALVLSATLLIRSVVNLRGVPTGFDIDHVALVSVTPQTTDVARRRQYLADAERRLTALPGVQAAGYARVIPIGFGGSRTSVFVPTYEAAPGEDLELNNNIVSAGYFAGTGIELRAGRLFDAGDHADSPVVVVVNETMAERFWSGRAIGRQFYLGVDDTGALAEVVGVVQDVKYRTLREPSRPSFYLAVTQAGRPGTGVLHVRTTGDPSAMLETLRRTVAEVDPTVSVGAVRTLRQQADVNIHTDWMALTIATSLGAAALLLAAIGLFGAMASLVGQRRREIAVRMALGARPGGVSRQVVGQSIKLALAGSAIGFGLAFWLSGLIENRLYGVVRLDLPSLLMTAAALSTVALAASWWPARRAAAVNPVELLRGD
jgi:predicted permease